MPRLDITGLNGNGLICISSIDHGDNGMVSIVLNYMNKMNENFPLTKFPRLS